MGSYCIQNKLIITILSKYRWYFLGHVPRQCSAIASKFQLSETKCSCLINYGLTPYFYDLLLQLLRSCQNIVMQFYKVMNKVVQRGQMDMFVRYFDISTNRVCSRYLTSIFLSLATAQHLWMILIRDFFMSSNKTFCKCLWTDLVLI